MIKIPIKTRLPLEAWMVAALVTLYSLVASVAHHLPANMDTPNVAHAKLMADGDPVTTSAIR